MSEGSTSQQTPPGSVSAGLDKLKNSEGRSTVTLAQFKGDEEVDYDYAALGAVFDKAVSNALQWAEPGSAFGQLVNTRRSRQNRTFQVTDDQAQLIKSLAKTDIDRACDRNRGQLADSIAGLVAAMSTTQSYTVESSVGQLRLPVTVNATLVDDPVEAIVDGAQQQQPYVLIDNELYVSSIKFGHQLFRQSLWQAVRNRNDILHLQFDYGERGGINLFVFNSRYVTLPSILYKYQAKISHTWRHTTADESRIALDKLQERYPGPTAKDFRDAVRRMHRAAHQGIPIDESTPFDHLRLGLKRTRTGSGEAYLDSETLAIVEQDAALPLSKILLHHAAPATFRRAMAAEPGKTHRTVRSAKFNGSLGVVELRVQRNKTVSQEQATTKAWTGLNDTKALDVRFAEMDDPIKIAYETSDPYLEGWLHKAWGAMGDVQCLVDPSPVSISFAVVFHKQGGSATQPLMLGYGVSRRGEAEVPPIQFHSQRPGRPLSPRIVSGVLGILEGGLRDQFGLSLSQDAAQGTLPPGSPITSWLKTSNQSAASTGTRSRQKTTRPSILEMFPSLEQLFSPYPTLFATPGSIKDNAPVMAEYSGPFKDDPSTAAMFLQAMKNKYKQEVANYLAAEARENATRSYVNRKLNQFLRENPKVEWGPMTSPSTDVSPKHPGMGPRSDTKRLRTRY